jgi:hypothetical protein
MPLSFVLFAFTGIVYLLQLFPLTGMFLMIVAAPFWSVLTVNAGFVVLGLEALSGRMPRLCVLVPLAWFGGYAAVAALNHVAFEQLKREVTARNAGKALPFSPETAALVINPNADALGGAPLRSHPILRAAGRLRAHPR